MPDNRAAIARIEAILNSGAKRAVIDGQSVEVDHDQLRRRLRELKAEDTSNPETRPRLRSIDLSNAW